MELGVDIGGLSVVHMRNAPPNASTTRSGLGAQVGAAKVLWSSFIAQLIRHTIVTIFSSRRNWSPAPFSLRASIYVTVSFCSLI